MDRQTVFTTSTDTAMVEKFTSAYSQLCISLGEQVAFEHLSSLLVGELIARKSDTASFERNDGRIKGNLKVTFTGPDADTFKLLFEEEKLSKSERLCELSTKLISSGISTSTLAKIENLASEFLIAVDKADKKELLHRMMGMVDEGSKKEIIYEAVTKMEKSQNDYRTSNK
ncbi:hypothetical protein QUN99_003373 [Vibrio parahaemolyticus]|nr:hypothetical protein [Vibrio parahaemolyticus]